MNKELKGSESRDTYKQMHKIKTSKYFYACDVDFVLVAKNPEGIIAFQDFKKPNDRITFAEVLAYNDLLKLAPVYIVVSDDPENGPFVVKEYIEGDWSPEPPKVELKEIYRCDDWDGLNEWEEKLREDALRTVR